MNQYGKFYSWEILNDNIAIKKCDKSSLEYSESGIPSKIRWFFDVSTLKTGEHKHITLIYEDSTFESYLYVANDGVGRTKIRWNNDFKILLKKKTSTQEKFSSIKFTRINNTNYKVEFL